MMILLIGSAILGTLLLTLVFCLPTDSMKKNVVASVDYMIKSEAQIQDSAMERYLWGQKETYTDSIMVQNAIEKIPEKSVFEHAMWVYHSDLDAEIWTPEVSVKSLCAGEDQGKMFLHEYSRYWHGYLIYLKPLLLVFNWTQIVIMGAVLQIALLIAVIAVAVRKRRVGIAAALVVGYLYTKPILLMASLTMTVCWIITLGAILYLLLKQETLEKKGRIAEFFLMIGIVTAYFDFLTYPIVTLGFPLCTYFLLNIEEKLIKNLQKLFAYSAVWGIGYAGMWAMKWIIADITLQTGTIRDAVWSIIGRTESIGGRQRFNGGFYVIQLNLQEYPSVLYWVGAALILVFTLIMFVVGWRNISPKTILNYLVLFIGIFCIPFAWIVVVQHHSALHARFTFRIISVAVQALSCIGIGILAEVIRKRRMELKK